MMELENKKEKQRLKVGMFLRMLNFMIRTKHMLKMMMTLNWDQKTGWFRLGIVIIIC